MRTSRLVLLSAVLLVGAWLLVRVLTEPATPTTSSDDITAAQADSDDDARDTAALRGSGSDGSEDGDREPGDEDEGSREDNRPTLERARSALEPGAAPPNVALVARVLGRDGKPAANVEATLVSSAGTRSVRIGSDGTLREQLPAGSYDLYLRAPDGILLVRGLRVDGVGEHELTLTEPGTIVVHVLRGEELVSDVEVSAEPIGTLAELLTITATTDSAGVARLEPLPAGNYRITARVPQGPELLVPLVSVGRGGEEDLRLDVPEGVRFHGTVRARGDGPPIEGARITLELHADPGVRYSRVEIQTNHDGRFDVIVPQGVVHRFRVEAEGYAPFPPAVDGARLALHHALLGLSDGKPVQYDVELGPGATIECHVHSDEETPMQGVVVGVRREGEPEPFARATSDAQGIARIPHLAAGTFVMMVLTQGLYTSDTKRAEVRIAAGDTTVQETLRVHAARRIHGTLLTAEGKGAGAARVWIVAEGLAAFATGFGDPLEGYIGADGEVIVTLVAETYTASDGSFALTDVPIHHDLQFYVRAARGTAQAPPVNLPQPEGRVPPPPMQLRLAPGATLSGTLSELGTGDALPGVVIDLVPVARMEGLVRHRLRTRADGSFGAEGIRPGKWHLLPQTPNGYLSAMGRVLTLGAKSTEVQLQLDPGVVAAGSVVNEDGLPVAGARISLLMHRGTSPVLELSTTTDERGRFQIGTVPNMRGYRLTARHTGYGLAVEEVPQGGPSETTIVLRRQRKPTR